MHLVFGSGILSLGESPSAFGVTLALVLIFFVIVGGLAQALIAYAVGQVMVERRQNLKRQREYDAEHGPF